MAMIEYEGDEKFRPLSPWEYFWYSILFAIPTIGLILSIVFALNDVNINRRNFARSFLIVDIIGLALFIIVVIIGAMFMSQILGTISYMINTFPTI